MVDIQKTISKRGRWCCGVETRPRTFRFWLYFRNGRIDAPLADIVNHAATTPRVWVGILSNAFNGAWWTCGREGRTGSEYRLESGQWPGRTGTMRISFLPKAEASSFLVALASLAAKYWRERLMGELNAWFTARQPDLAPTAGYYTDAGRFLAGAVDVLTRERVDLPLLIRAK